MEISYWSQDDKKFVFTSHYSSQLNTFLVIVSSPENIKTDFSLFTENRNRNSEHQQATMATLSSLNLVSPRVVANVLDSTKASSVKVPYLNQPWKRVSQLGSRRMQVIRPVRAAPDSISDKVEKSIKEAEEACSGDPASGECVAAWDEVEELSAAASHAREKKKGNDPLENYCKDHPETDECRTYED